MKKINNLSVWALKEKLYVAFMMFVVKAINDSEIIKQWFAFYVNKFMEAYERLDEAYLKYDIDACTKAVQDANNSRDQAFREMRDMIDMLILYPKSEAKTQAAEALKRVVELYGGNQILKLGMTAKTAAYTNMVEDFESKFPAEVQTAAIGQYLQALKDAQQDFDEKYMVRAKCESELVKGEMADARENMNEYYRLFVDAVNVKAYEDTEGKLDDFINLMNVEVGKNRTYTGQGQVPTPGSGSGSNTDSDDESVKTKTATFHFSNGNVIKLQIAVGAPIAVPANTEGYVWKPEIPAVMPATNKIFREVPIEDVKATATFHFLDHREEEIRQIVGSVLTAPANTAGCIWQPAVPQTMPAEDTAYYEMQKDSENTEGAGGSGSGGNGGGNTNPTDPDDDPDALKPGPGGDDPDL